MVIELAREGSGLSKRVRQAAGLVDRLPFQAMIHDGFGEPVAWSRSLEALTEVPPAALSAQAFWEGAVKLCGGQSRRHQKSLGPFPATAAMTTSAPSALEPVRLRSGSTVSAPLRIESAPLPSDGESIQGVVTAFTPAGTSGAVRPHEALTVPLEMHAFITEQLDQLAAAEDAYRKTGAVDREAVDIVVRRSLVLTRLALSYSEPGLDNPPALPFQTAAPGEAIDDAMRRFNAVDGRRPFQTFVHCDAECPLDRRDLLFLSKLVFDVAGGLTEPDDGVSLALTAEPGPAPICVTASWGGDYADVTIRNGRPVSRCRPALNAVFDLVCRIGEARLSAAGFHPRWEAGERHISLLSEPCVI